ncbi:acyltransferase family protein [Sphingomonas oryzagri]
MTTAPARGAAWPSQIVGIDIMRFLAAMMVAIYHITYISWADPDARGAAATIPFLAFRTWAPFVDTGWVGVQIFFVISGFVIAYTANGRSPADFIKGRALRLVPGVWICATASVGALLLSGSAPWDVAKAFMLSLIFFPIGPWVASSYWTLPVEIMFYALVLAVLARDRFGQIGLVATILGISSLVLWCWISFHALLGLDRGDHVELLLSHRFSPLLLVPHGCFFAIGTLMWLVKMHGPSPRLIAIILAFVAAGILEIDRETTRAIAWSGVPADPLIPILLFGGSVAAIAASIRWNGAVHGIVGSHAGKIRVVGLMTYPLYLLHQPFGEPLTAWAIRAGVPPSLGLILSLAVVLTLSALVAVWMEPRLRRLMAPQLTAAIRLLDDRLPRSVRQTRPIACR